MACNGLVKWHGLWSHWLLPFAIWLIKVNLLGLSFPVLKPDRTASCLPSLHAVGHRRAGWRTNGARQELSLQGGVGPVLPQRSEVKFSWKMVSMDTSTCGHTGSFRPRATQPPRQHLLTAQSASLGEKRADISKVWLKKNHHSEKETEFPHELSILQVRRRRLRECAGLRMPFSEDNSR